MGVFISSKHKYTHLSMKLLNEVQFLLVASSSSIVSARTTNNSIKNSIKNSLKLKSDNSETETAKPFPVVTYDDEGFPIIDGVNTNPKFNAAGPSNGPNSLNGGSNLPPSGPNQWGPQIQPV